MYPKLVWAFTLSGIIGEVPISWSPAWVFVLLNCFHLRNSPGGISLSLIFGITTFRCELLSRLKSIWLIFFLFLKQFYWGMIAVHWLNLFSYSQHMIHNGCIVYDAVYEWHWKSVSCGLIVHFLWLFLFHCAPLPFSVSLTWVTQICPHVLWNLP